MDIKETLKQIFLRPEQRIRSVEDLFEDGEAPKQEIAVKESFMDRIRFVAFSGKMPKIIPEEMDPEKLTVRQRIKRYNASMEGKHGIPEDARKK